MFERFTSQARQVVVSAQQEARTLGHPWVGTEHLLLGVLAQPDAPGAAALGRAGITLRACRATIEDIVGRDRGTFGPSDAAALRTLGIDLEEVRRRAEDSFGPGALDRPPPTPSGPLGGILPGRRRRTCGMPGHIPFMPRAKRALERALREALALHDRHVGVEHLLLGLLDPKGNLAVDVLRDQGVEPDSVRARVLADMDRAA